MSAFRRLFGPRWVTFTEMLWPPSLREEVRAAIGRLDDELRRRQARLLRCRQQIEKLRGRVEMSERGSERLRVRLQAAERMYERLRIRLERRKEQRKELHDLLLSALARRTADIRAEENDCDYPF
jgi:hypothetical protein